MNRQKILVMYRLGYTQKDIAARLGITHHRVSQTIAKEVSRLREAPDFEKQSLAAEQMLDHIPIPEGYIECEGLRELFEKGVMVMEKTDPWKHRSKGMTCSTCMWFVEKEAKDLPHACEDDLPIVGRCRRHAPTMNGYPVVFEIDWCGDHKLDENKV